MLNDDEENDVISGATETTGSGSFTGSRSTTSLTTPPSRDQHEGETTMALDRHFRACPVCRRGLTFLRDSPQFRPHSWTVCPDCLCILQLDGNSELGFAPAELEPPEEVERLQKGLRAAKFFLRDLH